MKDVEEPGEMAVETRTDKLCGETRISPALHKNIKYFRLYKITSPYFEERDEEHKSLLMFRDNQELKKGNPLF